MKAAMFHGGKDIRVEELPTPEPGVGEVLVDIGAAGICGSDLHPYRGAPTAPGSAVGGRRGGHELAGVIAAVGPGAAQLHVGQRVGVEPMHLIRCAACPACRRGDYHICPTRGVRNGVRRSSAGFSEFDLVASENVFPLPDHVSIAAASLLDVYACGVHGIHRVPIRADDCVAVIGTGPIGMTMGQVARAARARRVVMIGLRDEQLARAVAVGAADATVNSTGVSDLGAAVRALTDGEGCFAVYESVGGTADTIAQAVDCAAFGGAIGIIGGFWGDITVNHRAANRKEVDLRWCNSYASWHGVREFKIALDLIADGRVQSEALVTHRYPLVDIAEAFRAADDKRASGAIKVIVEP